MRSYFRILIVLSLTMNLLAVVGAVAIINKKGGMNWVCRKIDQEIRSQEDETKRLRQLERKKVNHQQLRASIFEQLPISPDDTVFLGDSMLSYGEWHEFFDDNKVKNRGISGDDTHSLLERLPQIIAGKPRHVVILCGINNFQKCIPCKQTTEEFARIVATISSQSQGSDIWLLPIFPVNKALYQKYILPSIPGITMPDQTEVEETNRFLKNLAGDGRPRVHFVDMHAFLNHTGELSEEYTDDGLHLNGRGMKEMVARLQALGL